MVNADITFEKICSCIHRFIFLISSCIILASIPFVFSERFKANGGVPLDASITQSDIMSMTAYFSVLIAISFFGILSYIWLKEKQELLKATDKWGVIVFFGSLVVILFLSYIVNDMFNAIVSFLLVWFFIVPNIFIFESKKKKNL